MTTGLPITLAPPLTARDLKGLSAFKGHEYRKFVGQRQVPDGVIETHECRSEVFELHHTEYGHIIFHIRFIKDAIVANTIPYRVYTATLTQEWYDHIYKNNNAEEPRIAHLSARELRVPPIATLDGSGCNFIDGTHRICRRWRDGLPTLRFILIPFDALVLSRLVTEATPDLLSSLVSTLKPNSGALHNE